MTKVTLYPADETACGSYRCIWPGMVLGAQGHKVTIAPPGHPDRLHAITAERPGGHRYVSEVVPPDADVVVVQRPLHRLMVEAMPKLRAMGIKVVVELDDDFRAVNPRNHAFRAVHPRYSPDSNWNYLAKALEHADGLVVSTPSLAKRYGKRLPTVVVANYVPEPFLTMWRTGRNDPPVVGWPGATATHPDDLQVTRGGVAAALRSTGAAFRVVGPGDGVARALNLDGEPEATGWVPLTEYPRAIAQLDVGIAPLTDDTFNRGKSWLKPLEMAALGVPCVMSPVAEYRALADLGIGAIAERGAAWERELTALVSDRAAREEEGMRLRAAVVSHGLTIEAQAHQWWDAWTSVL